MKRESSRDLKPANVKVMPDAKVKVLDFGLVKAMEGAPGQPNLSNSPTLSMAATNAGVILGTAAYMSATPFFSPDGRWLGFYSFVDNAIKKIPITGGAAVTLCTQCTNTLGYGVDWEGDSIIFIRNRLEVVRIPDTGGQPEVWIKAEPGEQLGSPHLLSGGDSLLFSAAKAVESSDKGDVVVFSRKPAVDSRTDGRAEGRCGNG
jgi:hypothetical protein